MNRRLATYCQQADSIADPALCRSLLDVLSRELDRPLRFMEVCGTHTVAVFRSGLRSLLPKGITHLSGPGCPVCVTHEREIGACLELAGRDGVILATFGDLLRVPGPSGVSLQQAQAAGARVEVVYSPLDALALARKYKEFSVVFVGVGFETTAPTVAAAIYMARQEGLKNFFVLSLHKTVPPALNALLARGADIDAFLLPGHVSTIIGIAPYAFLAEKYHKPAVVGGFEPADILQSLIWLVKMRKSGAFGVRNQYRRGALDTGNPKALGILSEVFQPQDALWRGLGCIEASGLGIAHDYVAFDAFAHFSFCLPQVEIVPGCSCGDILAGRLTPIECPLFSKICTPAKPIGPCMVSTEGSCAAHYNYGIQ